MCLSLYALLLRTLVTDLHAKSQHNICKVSKTVPCVKFTKCKTRNFVKKKRSARNSNLICKS